MTVTGTNAKNRGATGKRGNSQGCPDSPGTLIGGDKMDKPDFVASMETHAENCRNLLSDLSV